jgi:hypothetical protein
MSQQRELVHPNSGAKNQEKAAHPDKRSQLLKSKTSIQAGQCDPCDSEWCCWYYGLWPDYCCAKK